MAEPGCGESLRNILSTEQQDNDHCLVETQGWNDAYDRKAELQAAISRLCNEQR